MTRAQRRHNRARAVAKALRLFRMYDASKANVLDARGLCVRRRPHDPERLADHLRCCSCLMCSGRKRRVSGPTMRERRADDRQGVIRRDDEV